METPQAVMTITAEQLQEILTKALEAANKMNPIEEKKFREEMEKEERKKKLMAHLAKIEDQNMRQKRDGCSHCRWPMSHGKMGGHACPRGQGEWCTSGQIYNRDYIGLICQRCSYTWVFKASPAELEYAEQVGLLGMAPPSEDRLVKHEVAA